MGTTKKELAVLVALCADKLAEHGHHHHHAANSLRKMLREGEIP